MIEVENDVITSAPPILRMFRGARFENFLSFLRKAKGLQIVDLETGAKRFPFDRYIGELKAK